MQSIKKILQTPSAFVILLAAVFTLFGVIIKSKSDEAIARLPIDATLIAEAKLTEIANANLHTQNMVETDTPTEYTLTCPDRLIDDITTGNNDQSRLSTPYNLQITYRASVNIPGRILAEVYWVHADSRHVSSLIKISGRRGTPSVDDRSVRTDEPFPLEGKCGVWYRQVRDKGMFGGDVIEGLWANETYCFQVNDSDEDGGNSPPYPSVATAPICLKAEWSKGWGEPATPPP